MEYTDMEQRILDMWPKFKDGCYVQLGDKAVANSGENAGKEFIVRNIYFEGAHGKLRSSVSDGCYWNWKSADTRVKRPAPKVLDADGVEIHVGDTVYDTELANGDKFTVENIDKNGDVRARGDKYILTNSHVAFTHRAPVLAADGRPLREGETVWDGKGNGPYTIKKIEDDGIIRIDLNDLDYFASEFFSERPDSWERLERDAEKSICDYFGSSSSPGSLCEDGCPSLNSPVSCGVLMKLDLIRRAKALAEKEAAR